MKPELVWEIEYGLRLTALDLTRAAAARDAWYAAVVDMFETYDFVVAPSAQVFPFDKSVHWPETIDGRPMDTYHRWMETVVPWTMAGHPVAAMPAGLNARGLPMGIQIVGRRHGDHDVLRIAHAYEAASPVMDGTPPPLLVRRRAGTDALAAHQDPFRRRGATTSGSVWTSISTTSVVPARARASSRGRDSGWPRGTCPVTTLNPVRGPGE